MKKPLQENSLSFLLNLLRPYLFSVLKTALIGTMTILANTGLLAVSAVLICLASLMPPVLDLMPMSAGVRLFGISRGLFRYWERLSSHAITFQLLEDLRVWYYRKLLPLTPGGTLNKTTKLLKSVTEDLETLQFFYLRVVAAPLVALLTLLSISGILAFLLPSAIPILWITAFVNGILIPLFAKKQIRLHAPAALAHELDFRHHLQDFVMGLESLWVYDRCREQKKDTLSSYLSGNYLRQEGEMQRGHLNALSGICSGLALTATLWFGVIAVDQGQLNGLYLLAAGLLVLGALESVQPLPLAVSYYYDSIAAADNMLEITSGKPVGLLREGEASCTHPKQNSAPSIGFSNVSFSYPQGKEHALKEVSFTLPGGSNTAIIGQIGSGKSSLVALLMGYFHPDQGEIKLGEIPLHNWGKEALCRQISLVEQSPYLFTASLRENLELAAGPQTEEKLWTALDWACLSQRVSTLTNGLDTILSPEGQNFSSGERQRLALARMYLEDKPVIILDESLKNLDNTTSHLLMERILTFCKERTLIMISHDQRHPAYMDYILTMEEGRATLIQNEKITI